MYPFEYDENAGRTRLPIFNTQRRRAQSMPVTPEFMRHDFENQAQMTPLQMQPQRGYFDLQNQRSERQRLATVGINAARGSPAAQGMLSQQGGGGDQQFNAYSNMIQHGMSPRAAQRAVSSYTPGMMPGATGTSPDRSERDMERNVTQYATRMAMPLDEAAKAYRATFPAATQPSTYGQSGMTPISMASAQQPSMSTPPPQVQAARRPEAPGHPIQISEQQARQMLNVLSQQMPDATLGQLQPHFNEMMQRYGVDAAALWNKWHQEGSLGKFDYAQPGQFTPAQPRIDVPLNRQTGAGGIATLPNGQQIIAAQTPGGNYGRQVGPPIAYGPPLPPTPVMGAQPGYTPAPRYGSMREGITRSGPGPVSGYPQAAASMLPAAPAFGSGMAAQATQADPLRNALSPQQPVQSGFDAGAGAAPVPQAQQQASAGRTTLNGVSYVRRNGPNGVGWYAE
jgi:hypothetical protein